MYQFIQFPDEHKIERLCLVVNKMNVEATYEEIESSEVRIILFSPEWYAEYCRDKTREPHWRGLLLQYFSEVWQLPTVQNYDCGAQPSGT